MAEEQHVTKEPSQVQHEPQRAATKDPKKVEARKRLATHSHRQREAKKVKREEQAQISELNQYYGIGVVLAVGVTGGLGYYIYQSKKGEGNIVPHHQPPKQPSSRPQTNKLEM